MNFPPQDAVLDSKPSIAPILAVNFVGALGFSIVLPFLIFLVTRLGGNAVIYGIIGATYSAFQLVGAPILGRWSDRVGRKKVLLVSQLGTLASWGIFLIALAMPVAVLSEVDSAALGSFTLTLPLIILFVARAIDGLTGGNISVANAYLADITTEDERGASFGKMSLSANMGFVLGPAIAGVLGATAAGEALPVLAAFLISVIATGIIAFVLQDSRPTVIQESPEPTSIRDVLGGDQKECYTVKCREPLRSLEVLALPSVGLVLGLQTLVFVAFNFFYVAFPVYTATTLNWSLTDVGIYFAVMGILMGIVQGPVLSYLSGRVGEKQLVVVGSFILAASFVFFTSAETAVIYAGTLLLAVGNGLMWPSLLAILSKAAGTDHQGSVQGLSGSMTAVASIVGLVLGGVLFQFLGSGLFFVSAVSTGVAAVLTLALKSPPSTAGRARPGSTG